MNCFLWSADSQEAGPAGVVLGLCYLCDVPLLDRYLLSTQKHGRAEAEPGKTYKGGHTDLWNLSCFEAKLACLIKLVWELLFHQCHNTTWPVLAAVTGPSSLRRVSRPVRWLHYIFWKKLWRIRIWKWPTFAAVLLWCAFIGSCRLVNSYILSQWTSFSILGSR